MVVKMEEGHFYFLDDQLFVDFPNDKLEFNNKKDNASNKKPCYYSFLDENSQIYWMVPISSKVKKYRSIYCKKIEKYGVCDTLVFG